MNYDQVSGFAQSWGLLYFVILFIAFCAYALWPKNAEKFDRAAQMPLEDEEAQSNGPE